MMRAFTALSPAATLNAFHASVSTSTPLFSFSVSSCTFLRNLPIIAPSQSFLLPWRYWLTPAVRSLRSFSPSGITGFSADRNRLTHQMASLLIPERSAVKSLVDSISSCDLVYSTPTSGRESGILSPPAATLFPPASGRLSATFSPSLPLSTTPPMNLFMLSPCQFFSADG